MNITWQVNNAIHTRIDKKGIRVELEMNKNNFALVFAHYILIHFASTESSVVKERYIELLFGNKQNW